jgi:hypothetical protein
MEGSVPEYLDNPRRAVRAPLRCRAVVSRQSGPVETSTEDIGARGCQLILPSPLARGDSVGLTISAQHHPDTLRIAARVAWVSPRAPWRLGVAFAAASLPEAARWMETLVSVDPGARDFRRPPERVPLDATVYLGLHPGAVADFTLDEVTVLRVVGLGLPLRTVRERLTLGWPRMQRAIFSLLTSQALTLSRAASSHPSAWRGVIGSLDPAPPGMGDGAFTARPIPAPREASPEQRSEPAPTPGSDLPRDASGSSREVPPAAAPRGAATPPPLPRPYPARPPVPRPPMAPPRLGPPPPHLARAAPSPEFVAPRGRPAPAVEDARHTPDFSGAGVGWRGLAPRPRSPTAEAFFKHGLAELQAQRSADALKALRQALALAPGDPEIAAAIGRAMGRTG